MKIDFSDRQYETLLKMAYLGNWLVNGVRTGNRGDEQIEEYDDLARYIFSCAGEYGLEKYVVEEDDVFYPSEILEEGEVEGLIEHYDEKAFWEDLTNRLATRDFYQEYGEEAIRIMGANEAMAKDQVFLDKYWKEFDKNGIDNLVLKMHSRL